MKTVIIDYGLGNIWSVKNAFRFIGSDVAVSAEPDEVCAAECLILPGVGSFGAGMDNLHALGLIQPIKEAALKRHIPILGICLGMQLFADSSQEAPGVEGLGLIPGEVRKFRDSSLRLPHMGFNAAISVVKNDPYFDFVEANADDFYFVHSYYFAPIDERHVMAKTIYGGDFVSAIRKANIMGVQFHPEKSQGNGLRLIRRFLELNSNHV
jgi:glutamine amidotransferase